MSENCGKQRHRELYEHLTTIHMLCLLLMVSAFILSANLLPVTDIYPVMNIRFFVLAGLFCLAVVFVFRSSDYPGLLDTSSVSPAKAAYLTFPLLVALFTFYTFNKDILYLEAVLLLPILVAATALGKKGGLAMATACALALFVYDLTVASEPPARMLENNLLFISVFYVIGWFIGSLIEVEAQQREQLEANVQALQEEINTRKKTEEQLRKLSRAIEQSPSIVMILNIAGRIEFVNQKFSQVTGYLPGEIIGREIREIDHMPEELYTRMWDTINAGYEWRGEYQNRKKSGELYWESAVLSSFQGPGGEIAHYIKVAEDITSHKQFMAEMARLDRLNLVGEMAAGLGHEIRNPMTAVRGFLQLYKDKEDFARYKAGFEIMIEELDRANKIITEYLFMAKDRAMDLQEHNLNTIIKSLHPLLRASAEIAGNVVDLQLLDVPDLLLDEKEIRQLILNLVRNALEAMPAGGCATIKTYGDGGSVVLAVQDQGCGIPPEIMEKLGTPFFTTKDHGTGLGLPVCYSIISRHQANLKVDTGPKGTTFYIRFKQEPAILKKLPGFTIM